MLHMNHMEIRDQENVRDPGRDQCQPNNGMPVFGGLNRKKKKKI